MTTHRQRYKMDLRKLSATPVIMHEKWYRENKKEFVGIDHRHRRWCSQSAISSGLGTGGLNSKFASSMLQWEEHMYGEDGVREGHCLVWNCSAIDTGEIWKQKLRLIRRVLPHVAYLTSFSITFFYNKRAHEHHQVLLVDTGRSSSWWVRNLRTCTC